MRAYILSDNKEFIGTALGIPSLRKALEAKSGVISEKDVLELAKIQYIDLWEQKRELWNLDDKQFEADKDLRNNYRKLARIVGDEMPYRNKDGTNIKKPTLRQRISSENKEFVGAVLKIPPLRKKLTLIEETIHEDYIIGIAKELYDEYTNRYLNNKEEWKHIKETNPLLHNATQRWWYAIKKLLEDFSDIELG